MIYNHGDIWTYQKKNQETGDMAGLGTLINAAGIAAGGIMGLVFGKFMKEFWIK